MCWQTMWPKRCKQNACRHQPNVMRTSTWSCQTNCKFSYKTPLSLLSEKVANGRPLHIWHRQYWTYQQTASVLRSSTNTFIRCSVGPAHEISHSTSNHRQALAQRRGKTDTSNHHRKPPSFRHRHIIKSPQKIALVAILISISQPSKQTAEQSLNSNSNSLSKPNSLTSFRLNSSNCVKQRTTSQRQILPQRQARR